RQHQEELERTYRELAARERLACIGQMTAAVAHELRNPLGILLSSAQVVANPQRSPAQRAEAASFILDEVRRLDRTLAGFLEFARPRPPRLESLELPPLVRRALQTAAQHEQAKGVAFELILPEAGELPHVEADPDRLLQALLNLLLNACQAVGSAGGRVWLRLSVGRGEAGAPGFVAITVEDDGPGIPEELAGKVGEPFFTTRAEGMGLGLAIVRQTAQAHGGVLEIGRAAAGGAAVRLRLPLAGDRACAAPAAAVDEEERERGCGSAAARLGKEDEHDGSHDEPTNPG
ncbi:MAG: hypothetical protein FJ125_05565, partial [Deltaproteobacteria bacterium]|nr:hypothetical protein [Deltaproteobacteria bacterium]